jgi:hypothetical protein
MIGPTCPACIAQMAHKLKAGADPIEGGGFSFAWLIGFAEGLRASQNEQVALVVRLLCAMHRGDLSHIVDEMNEAIGQPKD